MAFLDLLDKLKILYNTFLEFLNSPFLLSFPSVISLCIIIIVVFSFLKLVFNRS